MTDEQKFNHKGKTFGLRHLLCFFIFLGLAVAHSLRVNLSVAIVAMTDENANPEYGTYQWDTKTKSLVLSSFFWGYVLTQIPSGIFAQKYGAHSIMTLGIFLCSLLATLTPTLARQGGWPVLCGLRLIQGICQGCVLPSTHTLLSKWAPVKERGLMGTLSYSGTQFGTSLMFALSGEISASRYGWPGVFYISGGLGCLWGVLFFYYGANSPSEHYKISEEEKNYIEMKPVPSVESPIDSEEGKTNRNFQTPWLGILTSLPFYCLLVVQCTDAWAYYVLLTQIPTYLKNIFGVDIRKNALLSSLPYWSMLVMCYVFLFISEVLRKTQCMSVSVSRRFFNSIGSWIPMLGLIGLGYMDKDNEVLVIFFLMLTVGMKAAIFLGFFLNHIDLAPNFAGTLMGITNCASHIASIMAPITVGFVVTDEKNPEQWKIIFFLTAGLLFTGNLLFICFGKFETQSWNEPQPVEIEKDDSESQCSIRKEAVH